MSLTAPPPAQQVELARLKQYQCGSVQQARRAISAKLHIVAQQRSCPTPFLQTTPSISQPEKAFQPYPSGGTSGQIVPSLAGNYYSGRPAMHLEEKQKTKALAKTRHPCLSVQREPLVPHKKRRRKVSRTQIRPVTVRPDPA